MKLLLPALALMAISAQAAVTIENVKIVITETGKSPVTVTIPYWVAKAGAQISDIVKVGEKDVDTKKILTSIENAPRLGTIMTVEDKKSKIVVSIE